MKHFYILQYILIGGVLGSTDAPGCNCDKMTCPQRNPDFDNYATFGARLDARIEALAKDPDLAVPRKVMQVTEGRELTDIGDYRMDRILGTSSRSSVVESVSATPDAPERVIIKYMDDCVSRQEAVAKGVFTDPGQLDSILDKKLLFEFAVQEILGELELAPRAYAVSAPLDLRQTMHYRVFQYTKSTVLKEEFARCAALGTRMRYIVQEKVGPTVREYVSWLSSNRMTSVERSRRMVVMFRKTMRLLKKVHSLGLMHGDIHGGNVAFRKLDPNDIDVDTDELVLLDFEMAKFFPAGFGTPNQIAPDDFFDTPSWLAPDYMAPWEVSRERKSARNDVYRALNILGRYLSRRRHAEGFSRIFKSMRALYGDPHYNSPLYTKAEFETADFVKRQTTMFKLSVPLGSIAKIGEEELISPEIQDTIRSKLEDIHDYIRSLDHPDTIIEYDWIDNRVGEILVDFDNS